MWWVKDPLDVARMRQAADAFVGMKDFRSFAEEGPRTTAARPRTPPVEKSTLVLVNAVDIVEDGDLLLVAIEGSHFLWKMVRRIVGVLVEIGRGGLDPADAARFLGESSEAPARLTAPASGLFLERVYYENDAASRAVVAATPIPNS